MNEISSFSLGYSVVCYLTLKKIKRSTNCVQTASPKFSTSLERLADNLLVTSLTEISNLLQGCPTDKDLGRLYERWMTLSIG